MVEILILLCWSTILHQNSTYFHLLKWLMGRVLRTILPTKTSLLKSKFPTEITEKRLKDNQSKQKAYYDKVTVKLSALKPKQPLYVQMGHRDWTTGTSFKNWIRHVRISLKQLLEVN
ncbi:hypothetical protein AVEN_166427-1 [Araneus ventricosus]|uniref:Uncharacterized protein n=1 Tax=Araneus ventricosus TaxID=182803 RepID=A0A4Y2F1N3_ARAVE|nr:hypothetical protein AVEN_166427-1 [Araneus ventricosus]